jgi:cysteine desulfurase
VSARPVIYLDANATTPLHPRAREAMLPLLDQLYGNPSSVHGIGQAARGAVDLAREQCAAAFNARPKDLTFTSGGTEAAQLAIAGTVRGLLAAGRGKSSRPRVLISAVEHPCVVGACEELEPLGVETIRIGVDANGVLDLESLQAALGLSPSGEAARPETLLCSVMAANNETGVLNPISAIAQLCRRAGVLFHTDAVQLAGKGALDVQELQADLLSISAHKLEGPKGAGLLWARSGVPIRAVQPGGHQERGRRGGTENAAAIAGLGVALELASRELSSRVSHLDALRVQLEAGLQKLESVRIVAEQSPRLCSTTCALFAGCDGQTLLVALDELGICVSTGSACSSGSLSPSPVLLAMGCSPDEARTALRFSFWRGNTHAEIDRVLELLPALVARARA